MTDNLKRKIDYAIKVLRMAQMGADAVGQPLELSYSGGKDSDVISELAKMAGVNYRAIYKNTTIDPPGTIAHCKANAVEIMPPRMRFFDLVKRKGFPTMRARFCCEILKEYKVLDNAVQGVRRSESIKRAKNYSADDPIICRIYGSKKNHVNVALPILNWTNDDVEEFIGERNIKCHPLYYDGQGKFQVKRRLGCLGCPLRSDRGLADFKQYPKLVKAWIRAGAEFLESHPQSSAARKIGNVYNLFYHNVFCRTYEDYIVKMQPTIWGGGQMNCKEFLEEYFDITFD